MKFTGRGLPRYRESATVWLSWFVKRWSVGVVPIAAMLNFSAASRSSRGLSTGRSRERFGVAGWICAEAGSSMTENSSTAPSHPPAGLMETDRPYIGVQSVAAGVNQGTGQQQRRLDRRGKEITPCVEERWPPSELVARHQ